MRKLRKFIRNLYLSVFACMILSSVCVYAEGNEGIIEITQLDMDTKQAVSGVQLSLYKIADYSDSEFTVLEQYSSLGIPVDELGQESVNSSVIEKLDQYIENNSVESLSTVTTDSQGYAAFTDLPDGIYMVKQTNSESDFEALGYTYSTQSYLIALPRTAEDGTSLVRTVSCQPKGKLEVTDPETVRVIVQKQWKDNNNRAGNRPEQITVELYKDGELYESIALNASNNWNWDQSGLEIGRWSVKEVDVPSGYESELSDPVVSGDTITFTITNTYNTESRLTPTPTPTSTPRATTSTNRSSPKTGDTTPIALWSGIFLLMIAALAGMMICRRRKH